MSCRSTDKNLSRRVVDALSALGMPDKAIARRAGINPYTWKAWREGRASPNGDSLSTVFEAMGPEWTAEVMGPLLPRRDHSEIRRGLDELAYRLDELRGRRG